MSRVLAWGRITKSDDAELTDALRKSGFIGSFSNKGVYGNILDRLIFEAQGYEHILGSASQLASDFATITYSFTNSRFEDKVGSEVVLGDYERVAVIGMDVFTGDMVIDNVVGLEMFHIGATPGQSGNNPRFELSDAGGGVPYKIFLGPNTRECKLDLKTDKDFRQLLNFTYGPVISDPNNARYVANQGLKNYITVNGYEAYNPARAGEIVKFDTPPINPYYLRMNGQLFAYAANPSVNGIAWFRDLNIALGGYYETSGVLIEYASRFTSQSTIISSPYLTRVNVANRFMTDISTEDTRRHQRTDPTGAAFVGTVSFNGTNIVTFTSLPVVPRGGMRIQGAGIPSSPVATTILRNYKTLPTVTAEMYNADTAAPVIVPTASGVSVTIDNSGAAGGSHDKDYFQNITGSYEIAPPELASPGNEVIHNAQGAYTFITGGGITVNVPKLDGVPPTSGTDLMQFNASNSPSARTHDQTQPISAGIYYYYKV